MSLFHSLFSKYKLLIYTAFGNQEYFRIAARLDAHGVRFRTKTHDNTHRGGMGYMPRLDNTQYDIYVAKEDEHNAQLAIHSK